VPGGPRRRRCLYITTPSEIAARTRTAIRIGTSGEEPPPLLLVVDAGSPPPTGRCGETDWCADDLSPPLAFLPPLALPPPFALPGPPPEFDDEPPPAAVSEESEELDPALPAGAEAPPPLLAEELAGFLCSLVALLPVTVGGESEYWTPLESA